MQVSYLKHVHQINGIKVAPALPPIVTTKQIVAATEIVFDIEFDPSLRYRMTKTRAKALRVAIALSSELQGFSLHELSERFYRDYSSIQHHLSEFGRSPELKAKAMRVKNYLGVTE